MKTFILSSLFGSALGGLSFIRQRHEEILKQLRPVQMMFAARSGPLNSMTAPTDMTHFDKNYGCWCYFEAEEFNAKIRGPPVDALDSMCRYYTKSVRCMAEEFGSICNPWNVTYESPLAMGSYNPLTDPLSDEMLLRFCGLINLPGADHNCALNTCAVEGRFLQDVLLLELNAPGTNFGWDPQYVHGTDFDPEQSCFLDNTPPVDTDISCCGAYPNKLPFQSYGGLKECCGDDGKTAMAGMCEP